MNYQEAIDNFTSVELIDRDVMVELAYIGEGISGDYNLKNPDDLPLLRFTVYKKEIGEHEWEQVEGSSYCTRIIITTVRHQLVQIVEQIMEEIIDDVRDGKSISKKCKYLSWVDEGEATMANNYEELYKKVGVKNHPALEKAIYKGTNCGAACQKIEGGVRVGAIIEGLDGDGTQYYDILFPFRMSFFWDKIQEVEDEVEDFWESQKV